MLSIWESKLTTLHLLVLKTDQLLEVKEFYERLGLEFVEEKHGGGPVHFAAELGSVVLELYPRFDGEKAGDVRLGFQIDHFRERLDQLRLAEVSILRVTKNRATIMDPDGRKVDLVRL